MRYDTEHKQHTRASVLKAAAKAIRTDGPHKIAVASVMAEAGLTHGGFYAHFASKDDLIAAAIEQMFEEGRARLLRETENRSPAEALSAYIDFYLSKAHRDARSRGCPVAALSSDLPRLADPVRKKFAAGVSRLTEAFAVQLELLGNADARTIARSMLSELVGALSLARIEIDSARSEAILASSRLALKTRLGLEQQS
jgi:TetR/AcrR family transcriptional repressor of nem operon